VPTKRCVMCKSMFQLPTSDRRYLILSEDFICGQQCLHGWIKQWVGKPVTRPMSSMEVVRKMLMQTALPIFKSQYEENFAGWLDARGIKWMYEPYSFPVGRGFYIPDFYLPWYDCFLETKGIWGAGSRTKFKKFREHYPQIRILLVSWLLEEEFRNASHSDTARALPEA